MCTKIIIYNLLKKQLLYQDLFDHFLLPTCLLLYIYIFTYKMSILFIKEMFCGIPKFRFVTIGCIDIEIINATKSYRIYNAKFISPVLKLPYLFLK